jgi:hypothetical protein
VARPLSYDDIKSTLESLDGTDIVLVGGQALNFWADLYLPRVEELARDQPYTSKDIDFCGPRHAVVECAKRLGGVCRLPTDFDPTVSTGAVLYVDASGEERPIDFISSPYGLDVKDVRRTAIPVEILGERDEPTGITFKVMNPERCMESRSTTSSVSASPATTRSNSSAHPSSVPESTCGTSSPKGILGRYWT